MNDADFLLHHNRILTYFIRVFNVNGKVKKYLISIRSYDIS